MIPSLRVLKAEETDGFISGGAQRLGTNGEGGGYSYNWQLPKQRTHRTQIQKSSLWNNMENLPQQISSVRYLVFSRFVYYLLRHPLSP
jgi:hypothetical protein